GARPLGRPVPRRPPPGGGRGANGGVHAAGNAGGRPPRRRRGFGTGGERAVAPMKSPLPVTLSGRDLLRIGDLVPAEVEAILDLATELRTDRRPRIPGQTPGLVFSQPSTRTRISFAVAAIQLGGGYVTLTPQEMQLAR